MRHHHNGSGRRTVLPRDWPGSQAMVADGFNVDATVSIRVPGGTTGWDDTTHGTTTTPLAPFLVDIPAKLQAITESTINPVGVADEQVRVLGYRVSIAYNISDDRLKPEAIVDVVTCTDPMLVGSEMVVMDVVKGPFRVRRDLFCTINV